MPEAVEVTVQVPSDRIRDFEVALGALVANGPVPAPMPGSPAGGWQAVTVPLPPRAVPDFYAAFGTWLAQATRAVPPLADMTAEQLGALCEELPRGEQELLFLLSDDFGRSVGWTELKAKLRLAGKPSLARDFPQMAARCSDLHARLPVEQDGEGDDAVFSLRPGLVDAVLDYLRST